MNNPIVVDNVVSIEKNQYGTYTYTVTADNWTRKHTRLAAYADEKTAKQMANNFAKIFAKKVKEINEGVVGKYRIMQAFIDNGDFNTKVKLDTNLGAY